MTNRLWEVRVKAFFAQLASLLVVAAGGVFLSEDFRSLVTTHFGDTFITSAALLFVTGLVSHVRNKIALRKLGAYGEPYEVILI